MNKILTRICWAYLLGILGLPGISAQDTLTLADKVEISFQAKLLVNEYQSLLNVLSNRNITLQESRILISNSFKPSGTQIFFDSLVVVEDDIDPQHTLPNRKVPDAKIPDYLNALYFLYNKADENTIQFSDLKTSPVQKGNYIFVQVIFDSQFRNKHKEVPQSYNPTKRIAEVRARRTGEDWDTKISSVIFWDSTQVFQDTTYEISASDIMKNLSYSDQQLDSLGLVRDETGAYLTQEAYSEKILREKLEEEARKKAERIVKENEAQYKLHYQRGLEMLEAGDYVSAKQAFTHALEYDEYRVEPRIQLNRIEQIQQDKARLARAQLEATLKKARSYLGIKAYDKALEKYRAAYASQPRLDSLNRQISRIEQHKIYLDRVSTHLLQQNYNEAIKDLNREIRQRPNLADLYRLRADAYALSGKEKRAYEDYQEAINRNNSYRDAYLNRANLYLKENNLGQATADYGMALTLDGEDIPLLTKRAQLNIRINQLAEAVSDYTKAIQVAPNDVRYYMERGKLYRKLGNYQEAVNDFSQASKLAEGDPKTWFFKGLAYIDLKDPAGAVKAFKEAEDRNLDAASRQAIQRIGARYFSTGKRLVEQGAVGPGVDSLTGAILIQPQNVDAWYYRGQGNLVLKDFLSAIEDFSQVVKQSPNQPNPYYQRGLAYLANNQLGLAANDFTTAGSLNPQLLEAQLKAGETYGKLKRYPEALSAFQRALDIDKKNPRVYFEMARMYSLRNDIPLAMDMYKQAIKRSKGFPEAHFRRGELYVGQKDYKAAQKDFEEAIKLKPDYAVAYFELGKIYHHQERKLSDAISFYSAALKHSSNYFSALYERGVAYYASQSYANALQDLVRATELDANLLKDPEIHYKMGWANLYTSTPGRARENFHAAQKLNSERKAGLLLGLGYCDVFEGKTRTGLDYMQQAFQVGEYDKKTILKNPLSASLKKNKEFKALVKQYLN